MPKGYRPYLPDQDLLLPPSLREWLPEDHLVYFVSDVVDQLDLSAIHAVYGEEKRGQPPYDPRLMTKLLVYGYCTGVFSSRRIQKRMQEDIPFKVLAAGNEPDFRTISDFRKIHLGTLQGLFEQVLEMALEVGSGETGAGVAGRDEGESQRQQAQGDELRADEGEAAATAGGSEGVAGSRPRPPTRKKTGGTATSGATSCRRSCGGGRRGWPRSSRPRRWSNNGRGRRRRQKARAPQRSSRPSRTTRINTTSPIRNRAS